MLILIINGSPNKNGNTAQMLNAALEEVRLHGAESTFVQVSEVLRSVKVPFCVACSNPCEGKCYRDTALEEVFEQMIRADGIILGSPVYFCTVSAQLKGFWDKTRKLRTSKGLVNTVGGALAVGGARFGGQETTVRALQDMMLCQGMTVVGDGFPADDAGHQGGCCQKPSAEDREGLQRTRILARRVVQVAKATEGLRSGSRS